MKSYIESKKGQRIGIVRVGFPKEVYFEAVVKDVKGEVVVLENDESKEIALPIEKIILVGLGEDESKGRAGFLS